MLRLLAPYASGPSALACFRFASVSLICLGLIGCNTPKAPPAAPAHCSVLDPEFDSQWTTLKPKKDCAIVDMHTHAFNARYLPIRHVIEARVGTTGVRLLPRPFLEAAAVAITGATPKTEAEAKARAERIAEWEKRHGSTKDDDDKLVVAMLETHQRSPRIHWSWSKIEEPNGSAGSVLAKDTRGTGDEIGPIGWIVYHLGVKSIINSFVSATFSHGDKQSADTANLSHSIVSLMSSESEILKRMDHFFPEVDLFVYQSMDLVPSFYPQGKTGTYAYSYSKDDFFDNSNGPHKQGDPASALPRIRAMCKESDGRMIHFVAWNPFRTVAKNAYPEMDLMDSLSLVQRAVANGASGVKFYPPLGYRPHCNHPEEIKRPSGEAGVQYDSRYRPGDNQDRLSGKTLDDINESLFAWCASQGVPIFTHCNVGEFRAYDDPIYAEMANPEYWKPVLIKHPNLRLCFGHAGGEADWYGDCAARPQKLEGQAGWGKIVRELCLKYPNVYCEFGIHEDVADKHMAGHLYKRLVELLPTTGEGGWPLADKVMYGSDHFMPINVPPPCYLESFEKLFSIGELRPYKAKFFSGNAMKYLQRDVARRN